MKYIIEYRPQISEECQTYISNNINPVYTAEDTDIYSLNYVYEALSEELGENNNEEIFGISLLDMKKLEKLINEQVDYIEF
jgi:hypothetical protein